jgi:predicted DNA-binding transcriptional regulator YafY
MSKRDARQAAIVYVLRSKEWTSAKSLAQRFAVTIRTIYRDVEDLLSAGVPIEAAPGPEGGYRLVPDQPIPSLALSPEEALSLYVLHQVALVPGEAGKTSQPLPQGRLSNIARLLVKRVYFDTADWYWRDEGSAHLPVIQQALVRNTALTLTMRERGSDNVRSVVVQPYGVVWKGGEWHLVAAPIDEAPVRFRLNLVDQVSPTRLTFPYPDDFDLRAWWQEAMTHYGEGNIRVLLRVLPSARDELLRLSLKSTSEIEHTSDGGLVICLYVDRWQWLIPLIASYGEEVVVSEPEELRSALVAHLSRAVAVYSHGMQRDKLKSESAPCEEYRDDDSRLRSTRGRSPRET